MEFEIATWAFMFNDYPYFQWFRKRTRTNLNRVIKWKRLRRAQPTPNEIDAVWNENNHDLDENQIEQLPFSMVARAFLFHLKRPILYPILDSNAFRAMRKLSENYREITHAHRNNWEWEPDYTNGYRQFFQEFYQDHKQEINAIQVPHIQGINEEIIRRRILDRAVWAYGRD
jgi:hypothetical protein